MATMSMTAVGANPDAATLNGNVAELEKINGTLNTVNLDASAEITKDKLRSGSQTRHVVAAAVRFQSYDVAAPADDTEIVHDEEFFVPGGAATIVLPPGDWDLIVNFNSSAKYDELVWREDDGAWNSVLSTGDYMFGAVFIAQPQRAYTRRVTVAVKRSDSGTISVLPGGASLSSGFQHSGHMMSISAFRTI